MPAGLVITVMGDKTRRDLQTVRLRRIAHQPPIVATGPDTMPLVEEQGLRIDRTNAANIAPLARVKIIDDEVIAGVAHGVQQAALFIVQKTAAAFLGNQRIPPKNTILAGVESQERGAAKTSLGIVPGVPRRIAGQIDRWTRKVGRHIQHTIVHRRSEAVVNLAL